MRRRRPRFLGGFFSFLFILLVGGALVGGLAAFGVYRHIVADLPDYRWLADYQPPQMSRIYAADSGCWRSSRPNAGSSCRSRRSRSASRPPSSAPRTSASGSTTASIPIGILRAAITNIEQYGTGRRMGGASTITQQVAKNMLVGSDRIP